eukprot:GDKI01005671.1.p1 GENE.GDKI01005671.1~~GDKI01005671.1.p1  ORF type:complete len:447 (-),score=89.36 GDKI01005671.1:153-1493(-)
MCVCIGVVTLGGNMAIDTYMYSQNTHTTHTENTHTKIVFPLLNFLRFNLLIDGGRFYGTHIPVWYFFDGMGTVLLSYYPFFFYGIYSIFFSKSKQKIEREVTVEDQENTVSETPRGGIVVGGVRQRHHAVSPDTTDTRNADKIEKNSDEIRWGGGESHGVRLDTLILIAITCSILVLSLASHKEFRFILPYLPFMHIYLTAGLFSNKVNKKVRVAVFALQFVATLFFMLVHQQGPESVMKQLRAHVQRQKRIEKIDPSIFFLTGCHATPFYTHMHVLGDGVTRHGNSVRFPPIGYLDCSPQIIDSRFDTCWRDRFYKNPEPILDELFVQPRPHAHSRALFSETTSSEGHPFLKHFRDLDPSCLAYRFSKPPWPVENYRPGDTETDTGIKLPSLIVVWGGMQEQLSGWLGRHQYKKIDKVFDALWNEGPYGVELLTHFLMYERVERA